MAYQYEINLPNDETGPLVGSRIIDFFTEKTVAGFPEDIGYDDERERENASLFAGIVQLVRLYSESTEQSFELVLQALQENLELDVDIPRP